MGKNKLIINIFGNSLKILETNNCITVHIYNDINSFKLIFSKKDLIFFNKNTSNLVVQLFKFNQFSSLINSTINDLLFCFNRLWHVKIKFTGKGYKIKRKKKQKSIKFYFYYSHVNVIILRNAKLKQRKKNKFIIKTWSKNNLKVTTKSILSVRNLNVFTKRGLRSSRQIIFKKTGKKSNY